MLKDQTMEVQEDVPEAGHPVRAQTLKSPALGPLGGIQNMPETSNPNALERSKQDQDRRKARAFE